MSARAVELALARLYTEPRLRDAFLQEPLAVLAQFDLTTAEQDSLLQMDRAGLVLAARSYAHKRERYGGRRSGWQRLARWLKTLTERVKRS